MTEVVSMKPELSDSLQRTRPHFQTYLTADPSVYGNQINVVRNLEPKKFPQLVGRHDYDSLQCDPASELAFKKWNDEGDYRALPPTRFFESFLDPVSGFISAGGEVDHNTGSQQIRCMAQLPRTPQSSRPRDINSIRMHERAPQDLQREGPCTPGQPSKWNSKKVSDRMIRCGLGGWTSDYDPRQPPPQTAPAKERISAKLPSEMSKESRDKLALKYMYTSSIERSNADVPWDDILHPKDWWPVHSYEVRPDNVAHRFTTPKKYPVTQEWQSVGRSWDRFQNRQGYYKNGPINFCSPCFRVKQIPKYSGCIGAENLDEVDNPQVPFHPFTINRSVVPHQSETAHRPNIPGYTGCTLYQGIYRPAHNYDNNYAAPITSASAYRNLPSASYNSEFRRVSALSRMVTPVPPCNPFCEVKQDAVSAV